MVPLAERLAGALADPVDGAALRFEPGPEGGAYVGAGTRYPVVRGIPRFVSSDHYVGSFSLEWNLHSRTQLDTARNDRMSEDMLIQKTGFTRDELAGRLVLDAGVGAGRYAEVASRWGADVVGVDLSYAVEAAHANLRDRPNVWIAQADIGALPFAPGTFDAIFSIGVLHHTPDTRRYFQALLPLLKPGGTIAIWVYSVSDYYRLRSEWVRFVNKLPSRMFYEWCRWYVPWVNRQRDRPLVQVLEGAFQVSNQGFGAENDVLDTFDGYSPRYHFIHTPAEVEGWFREAGLEDVRAPSEFPTCMRGRKPA